MEAMLNEKHVSAAVLLYFIFLFLMVLVNLLERTSFLDVVYCIVVVSCVFKYFIILKNTKK
ncbi:MAG: hypothetical protein PUB90_00475 [bacterium]|nr:hypothetical protein [bacterium]